MQSQFCYKIGHVDLVCYNLKNFLGINSGNKSQGGGKG